MTPTDEAVSDDRWQTSILSGVEKKALVWMAHRTPSWISPDLLTYLGLFGLALSGLSYYLVRHGWWFLIIASVGLVINWLGDSMDGTLARVRNRQRPKYGYYLDHLVDAFGISLMIIGLAYSGLISQPFVWLVLILFFIASINTYLATHTVNIFKISYQRISTTEARVLMIIMNTVLIFIKTVRINGFRFYWLDFVAGLGALFLLIVTIRSAFLNLRQLDREERSEWSQDSESQSEQKES